MDRRSLIKGIAALPVAAALPAIATAAPAAAEPFIGLDLAAPASDWTCYAAQWTWRDELKWTLISADEFYAKPECQ